MHGVSQSFAHSQDCKAESIRTHRDKVKKIMAITFFLTIIQILYGKSYVSDVANRFIDDEYDRYEKSQINYAQNSPFPVYNNLDPISEIKPFDNSTVIKKTKLINQKLFDGENSTSLLQPMEMTN